jgi:CoA:oxalate CoA-transferase
VTQPYAGIRVIEVGGTVSSAAATKTFSDFGADVIKVEPIDGGLARRLPPFPDDIPNLDRGAFHLALDTGKRSIALDVTTASGREIVARLADDAELLIQQQAPADADALLDRLSDQAPSTVTISPHGLDGPYRDRIENDMTTLAWTTRMQRHSNEGEEPLRYAPEAGTIQVGATAAAAGSAAIWRRTHEGERFTIEIAGVEAMTGNVDSFFTIWSMTGADLPRPAGVSKVAYVAGNYPCKDGFVLFASGGEPFFSRLCDGIGHPELKTDPRFFDPEQKPLHWDDFMTYLQPWLDERTKLEVFTQLQDVGVMVAPILEVPDALTDPQAVARGSFVKVDQPDVGAITLAGPPFRLGDAWQAQPAPRLGEHTSEVLGELGYSADEQIALFRAGVTA